MRRQQNRIKQKEFMLDEANADPSSRRRGVSSLIVFSIACVLFFVYGLGWGRFNFVQLFGDGHIAAKHALSSHILQWKSMRYFTRTDRIAAYVMLNPWVHSVQAFKSFDGGLMLRVGYKKPIFRAIDGRYLVDDNGGVITAGVEDTLLALPTYAGDQSSLFTLYEIWKKLDQWQARLLSVECNPYTGWTLQFDNRIIVRLGTKQLSDRVGLFVKVAARWALFDIVEAQVFDMRYHQSFTHKKITND